MILVLDTHVLVWYFSGDHRLSHRIKKVIQSGSSEIVIPAMAAAELAYLQKKGRVPLAPGEINSLLGGIANVTVFPIDMQVVDAMPEGLDIHDALIVATAILLARTREEEVRLATQDEAILKADLVKIFW